MSPLARRGPVVLVGALIVALVMALVVAACGTTESAPPDPARQIPVETTTVVREDVDVTIEAVGTLRADRAVEVRPKRAGHVRELPLVEGAPVVAGAVLASLDDTDLRAQVDVAAATLLDAQVRARNARRQHERAATLLGEGIVAQQQHDDLRAELDRATASVAVAEAALALARAHLAETVVRAPFDGIVGQRRVDVGAYVGEGDTLVTLVDLDPLEIEFAVPDRHLALLQADRPVAVAVASHPDRRFVGRVVFVAPEVDEVNRTVTVKAALPNPDTLLRPGQFATVTLTLERRQDALLVPEEALLSDGRRALVFVVADDVATARPVRTGTRTPGRVQIVEGLDAGDRVVSAGHEKLDPGAENPVREADAPAEGS
jgi:membrane fusion protein (multidrug efflux system)